MTIYTIALPKGGSTKTTTAAELAHHLARHGRRVLAIDCDRQGNFTTRLGVTRDTEVEAVTYDLFTGEATAEQAAVPSPTVPGVDVIAGTQHLAQVDHMPNAGMMLRDYLPSLSGWDDIVLDTPPSLGVVTMAALVAADVIVAPVTCEGEAFEQLGQLGHFVDTMVARGKPGQRVRWVIPTRHDGRRVLDREVVELLTEKWGDQVTPPVREGVVARDAYLSGQPVGTYSPRSGVAVDYADALGVVTGVGGDQ